MRRAIAAIGALLALNVFVIFGTATGTGNAWPLAQGLVILLVLAGVTWLVVWLLTRWIERKGSRPSSPVRVAVPQLSRALVVTLTAAVCDVVVLASVPDTAPILGLALYYVVLFVAGMALAVWARSGGAAPLWMAVGILLALAVGQAVLFAVAPDNRLQYGPEVYLFAVWSFAARLNMLALDSIIAWSGWRVARLSGAA